MAELRANRTAYATVVDTGELCPYIDQMPSLRNEKLRRVAMESSTADIAKPLIGASQLRWLYGQLL